VPSACSRAVSPSEPRIEGSLTAPRLVPGTPEYEAHLRGDIEVYSRVFGEPEAQELLVEPSPQSWHEVHVRAAELVRAATGDDMQGHVVRRLRSRRGVRMVSLGSGPGGVELEFAQQAPEAEIECLDINDKLLELGQKRADELGVRVTFKRADLNTAELPERSFDYAFCHASLHHLVELEHVTEQIRRCLRPSGELITVDVVTMNGYQMWPPARPIVRSLFRALPERLRVNHTAYDEPRVDEEIWEPEPDTAFVSMECIRSEDIIRVLSTAFSTVAFVPYLSIGRRFLDLMYGPNYDLSGPLDCAVFNFVWALDCHYIETGLLPPETFFGIYRVD
jgi:ubiquinone/menaquinone biosynthesis C-methylase UbiE